MTNNQSNDYATVQPIRPEFRKLALWVLDSNRRARAAFAGASSDFPAIKIEADTYLNAAGLVMSEEETEILADAIRGEESA